ncbi:hypothetical protein ACKI2C_51330, partial [Streptomyces brasiliscabiei]|uniref:hypothetical protein n=1 Tax=Streptomyces brasiliscabiei TaxID=2736302 RepID=UPI0038F643B3
PAIGVVYSPTLKKASWFDLTKHASVILENDKPPIIKQKINRSNVLEIGQGLNELIKLAHQYYELPVTIEDVEKLVVIQEQV